MNNDIKKSANRDLNDLPLEDLAARVRAGDRSAAAVVVIRYGPMFRQRIRRKLSRAVRTLFDSEDVVASVARRLDQGIADGRVHIADGEHLLALIQRMIQTTVVDKSRIASRLRVVEGPDSEWARVYRRRAEKRDELLGDETLECAIRSLDGQSEQLQLSLWLRGEPHQVAADRLGISAALARKRWENIRHKLEIALAEDDR